MKTDVTFKEMVKVALAELLEEGVVSFDTRSFYNDDRVGRVMVVSVCGEVVSTMVLPTP